MVAGQLGETGIGVPGLVAGTGSTGATGRVQTQRRVNQASLVTALAKTRRPAMKGRAQSMGNGHCGQLIGEEGT